jgi:hypothetical protein
VTTCVYRQYCYISHKQADSRTKRCRNPGDHSLNCEFGSVRKNREMLSVYTLEGQDEKCHDSPRTADNLCFPNGNVLSLSKTQCP